MGSGTGQHAVYFGENLPNVSWQTADRVQNHPSINAHIVDAGPSNVLVPLALDVNNNTIEAQYDAIFTANTCHIMSWPQVEKMFALTGGALKSDGMMFLYGPFKLMGNLPVSVMQTLIDICERCYCIKGSVI